MKTSRRFWVTAVLLGLLLGGRPAWAELTLNLIAVNPSAEQPREMDVKYYLPRELEPDDVLDTGGLKMDYDVLKGAYYVATKETFAPKESKTYKIRVRDVWRISPKEIEVLKRQLEEHVKMLAGKAGEEVAVRAGEKMNRRLDFILAQQEQYSEDINRRIEEFRAYRTELDAIRDKIYDFDNLVNAARTMEEQDTDRTVALHIEVTNPSATQPRTVKHKHLLPEEVRADDVVETAGFEVRFDAKTQRAYLSKEETFRPGETKTYTIVLKDIWRFPMTKLDQTQVRLDEVMEELKGSFYEPSAQFLHDQITREMDLIRHSYDEELPVDQYIGISRVDEHRFRLVEKDLKRLEKMMAIVRAKRLEELEGSTVKNVLQRLRALRGLAALSEAIFKKGISVTATWRIIMGTIVFLALFTTVHFAIWAKRSGTMGEERGLPAGESIREVPKPGEETGAEEEA